MVDQLKTIDVIAVTEHMVHCRRSNQTGTNSPESFGVWIPWGQLRAYARMNETVYSSALVDARKIADLKGMRRWAIQAPPFASNLFIRKDQAEIALPSIVKLWHSALAGNGKDASLSASVVAIDPDEVFNWRPCSGGADVGDGHPSRDR